MSKRCISGPDALPERLFALTVALLHINASLDLDNVLAADSGESAGQALTRASFGVITTIGLPIDGQDHVRSGVSRRAPGESTRRLRVTR